MVLATVIASFGSLFGKGLTDLEKSGLILAGAVVASLIYYYGSYIPLRKALDKGRHSSWEFVVKQVIAEYRKISGSTTAIRANVMRVARRFMPPPREKFWTPFRRRLRFVCKFGEYRPAESIEEWPIDVGCCGSAFKENGQVYFDSVRGGEALKGMDGVKREVTNHVKSILSTPIYAVNDKDLEHPIGIFNLDSTEGQIDATKFDDPRVRAYIESIAGAISAVVS